MPERHGEIVIVGLGPGPLDQLTPEARTVLENAPRVLLRIAAHPVAQWLIDSGRPVVALDFVYAIPRITYPAVYEFIADIVVREARLRGTAVYAVPGHPLVFESTPALIESRARAAAVGVRIIPGLSFLDVLFAELRVDPVSGLHVVSAFDVGEPLDAPPACGIVAGQLLADRSPDGRGGRVDLSSLQRWLLRRFPPDHTAFIVWNAGGGSFETRSAALRVGALVTDIDAITGGATVATIYVPPETTTAR
jgi:tetrapyrrole methylase family protein/MazG family protein